MIRLIGAILALLLLAPAAQADELRPFSITFTEIDAGQWSLDWKQPLSRPGDRQLAVPQVPENCQFSGDVVERNAPLALIGHADVACQGPLAGGVFSLPQLTGNADALLRIEPLDGEVQSLRLTARNPSAMVASDPDVWSVLKDYFVIGTEHILMGWDHLLFVIALVLLVVRGWAVVGAATAFTISHSITLAASVLGYTGLPQAPVEALIALSIVFLAVELARGTRESWTRRWPWLVAFGFGLLHGFGFAGALAEIGLPKGEVPAALLAFNLGVEAGQIAVIIAVLVLRALIRRVAPVAEAGAIRIATYGIGITAGYWLIDRVMG